MNEFSGASSTERAPVGRLIHLVFEEDPLVSADIVGFLETNSDCQVIHVQNAEDIATKICGIGPINTAFLAMRYADVVGSGLDMQLADQVSRIVLTVGERDERLVAERGWHLLMRPFSDTMIAALMPATAQAPKL